jgi:hypothetical protein
MIRKHRMMVLGAYNELILAWLVITLSFDSRGL